MIITNILNGIGKKLRKKTAPTRFKKISWLTEKILKHEEDFKIKHRSLPHFELNYKRPYEVIKTYKEIFNDEIYKFPAKSELPIIIDCGANIGLSTMYFKLSYPNSKIYAFEPDPAIHNLLELNMRDNKMSDITVFNQAVWIKDCELAFNNKGTEASQLDLTGKSAIRVKAIRLCTFLDQFDHIDFFKMDIEGAEYEVVQDIARHLHKIQNFFLEYHGTNKETQKLIILLDVMKSAGFKIYIKMAADVLSIPFIEQSTGTPYDVQLNIFCYK